MRKISQLQRDALEESANIGIGHASMSLSKMLENIVNIDLITTDLLPIQAIMDDPTNLFVFEYSDTILVAIYIQITGDITGASLLLFPKESALALVDIISDMDIGTTKDLNLEGKSALGEVGDILVSSYLTALNKFLKLDTMFHPPTVISDTAESVVNFIYAITSEEVDYALVSEIGFSAKKAIIHGTFALIFDEKSLDQLLDSIDKMAGIEQKSPIDKLTGAIKRVLGR